MTMSWRRALTGGVCAVATVLTLAATPGHQPAARGTNGDTLSPVAATVVTSAHARKRAKACAPGVPRPTAVRLRGAIQMKWAGVGCANRYRLRISPARGGAWPGGGWYTPWVSGYARSATWKLPAKPHLGDGMTGVEYGNPVYVQVQANNSLSKRKNATRSSAWKATWAWPPSPPAGDRVRLGSYNTMLWPTDGRATAEAVNIGSHGLTIAALQEARMSTAARIVSILNARYTGTWAFARFPDMTEYNPAQQVIYRSDLFRVEDTGIIDQANPRDRAHRVVAPYAGLRARHADGSLGGLFYVVSAHFAGTPTYSLQQNAWTGAAAQVVANAMKAHTSAPVVVAGDMRDGRLPYGDRAGYVPAQPTFVRNGYYDTMAALSMRYVNYPTVNSVNGRPSAHQYGQSSGSAGRADYILVRGIRGAASFTNVANWSYGGLVPSDHNLVYTDLNIPRQ